MKLFNIVYVNGYKTWIQLIYLFPLWLVCKIKSFMEIKIKKFITNMSFNSSLNCNANDVGVT